jgi:RimJ/RimL family protein N-acetyltransferase
VPDGTKSKRLVLRPLRATDAALDYDAVMSSALELRRWNAGHWPADGFTLAENLADLERHEREHVEREAFTYTVQSPDAARCLGCVYIKPVWSEAAPLCGEAARAATVGFWVRTSEIEHDLDRHLLAVLLEWLRVDWPFDCILFTNMAGETRQAVLLGQVGLTRLPLTWCDGRSGSVFRASWPRYQQAL